MNKGLSGFFKSSAFARSLFVFGAVFCAALAISCRQLASFDPVVDRGEQNNSNGGGGGGTSSGSTEFSFNLKASHGLKRKVLLEWDSFSGADYYEIYFAESSSAEFLKIGESMTNSFDDNLSPGRTGYFKVRAAKNNGACSPFSSTVVGTSLAMPIISGGEVNEFDATVMWSMENARSIDGTDYYESSLIFEVVCQSKDGSEGETKVFPSVDFAGSSYSCKFENLSSSRDYEFYVKAYLEGDAQSFEQSPTVDKTTLTAYTPLAPKFTASEGDNAEGIFLLITLPEKVTVMTYLKDSENPKEMQDVLYPLFFEVYRKPEGENEYSATNVLYYNGKEFTTSPIEYEEDGKPYEAGAQVAWLDKDPNLVGGEKYDYMIRSVVDINYSKVVCPEDKLYDKKIGTPESMTTTARGWKSAHPSFNVEIGERKLSADMKEVVSVSVGFSAEWKDLGKAENYKFAIKRNYTPFGSNSSTVSNWLKNGESIYFDTLGEVKSKVETFGSANGGLSKDEQGTYSYTLYIVAKIDNGTADIEDKNNILDSMDAIDRVVVTKEVNIPKSVLAVQDGYKDRVHLVISEFEKNEKSVTYTVERTMLKDGKPTDELKLIPLSAPESGVFEYNDTEDLKGNCTYSYVLKASAASGVYSLSKAQVAETLGTPSVTFREGEYAYDSISISFDKVLAAKTYVVKLGEEGNFGNGEEYTIDVENATSSKNSKFSLVGNTYNVTINRPTGYDNARIAGLPANLTVTAVSRVKDKASSEAVPVNVVGPAFLNTLANKYDEAKDDSISVSWNVVNGAKGYLIKRVMYSDTAMENVAEASEVVYYYDYSTIELAEGGGLDGRASVSNVDGRLTLTDKYKPVDPELSGEDVEDVELKNYQATQAKIPWGLPFRYVVLPVLEKGDFSFGEKEKSFALEDGKVLYKNLKQTEGCATFGYGLKVHAEKSKNATTQKITWKKPFYADKYSPRVFKRSGSSDDFTRVGDPALNAESFSYEPKGDDIYKAYEYIVKYNAFDYVDLHESLADEFENLKDSESEEEQANMGYLFTVKDDDLKRITLSAAQGGSNGYAEKVTWSVPTNIWDPKTRALGPTGIKLYIRNNNLDAEWHPAASINSLDYSGNVSGNVTALGDDVSATKDTNGISLYPTTCANGTGTTTGLLKVLRDYKHYYAIALTRGDVEVRYTPGFDNFTSDNAVVAYRRITDEELLKATMLIIADMENNSSARSAGSGGNFSLGGVTGSFSGSGSTSSQATWGITNYTHQWKRMPNGDTSVPAFMVLEVSNAKNGRKYGKYFVSLYSGGNNETADLNKKISVSVTSNVYGNARIEFAADKDHFAANVIRDGTTVSFTESGLENCRYWLPIDWFKDGTAAGLVNTQKGYGYFGEDPNYGWWPAN